MQLGTDSTAREALLILLALGLGAIVGLERRLESNGCRRSLEIN